MRYRKEFILLLLLTIALVFSSCSATPTPATPTPTMTDWDTSTPEQQGMNVEILDQMMSYIDEHNLPIDSVVVVRNGQIVLEEYLNPAYGPDTKHSLHSITKSFISALVGIAIEKGYIQSLDQKVIDFFPEMRIENLDQRKRDMTIKHLLTMTPGYQWEMNDGGQMRGSLDPVQFVLDKPMIDSPGTVFTYGNGASHLLSAIISETTGKSSHDFAQEHLFGPLGIQDVLWESKAGISYGGSGLHLTPRDMAKLGYLYLNDGVWNGEQVVPADWIKESTEIQFSGDGNIADRETYIEGYGYQWWIKPQTDVFYASGAYEQKIYVVPDLDLVVVFTANNNGPEVTAGLLTHFLFPAIEGNPTETYTNYGFSFDYPKGMAIRELAVPGQDEISASSGLLQFQFDYPFLELLTIIWSKSEVPPPPDDIFDVYYDHLGVEFDEVESIESLTKDDREIMYQKFTFSEQGYKFEGIVSTWYSETQERVYLFAYTIMPVLTTQVDLMAKFQDYLEAFDSD
jgi:CubicO group peptidase (beta-lactamase class C family)